LYYEFLSFGLSTFVAKNAPVATRSGVWSIVGVFGSIAYCIGPLIGNMLFVWKGNLAIIIVYAGLALFSYIIWLLVGLRSKNNHAGEGKEISGFSLWEEIGYWKVLFSHVWPILLVSYLLAIVDATFWTTGVVLSDVLLKEGWLGGLFLSAYTLPAIFIGFLVARMGIYQRKKKLAEIFLLLSGLLMAILGMINSTLGMVLTAFLIGAMTSVAWPLTNAVYSDILARMGKEQKHLMGMSNSMGNLSYITGPVIAGFLAGKIGEQKTMMWVGIMVVVSAVILLFVTPRKLRLPQSEMMEWKD
jgi:MFS family permease